MDHKPGRCAHCKGETTCVWVDTRCPDASPIYLCAGCIYGASIPKFASPAYKRVGLATYTPLLKSKV